LVDLVFSLKTTGARLPCPVPLHCSSFLAGEKPGVNPNTPLVNYIAKNVEVKGMVIHKAKANGIVIKEVKEL